MNKNEQMLELDTERQAAWWVARLDAPDCDAAQRAAFEDWLAQSPRHIQAWIRADALHSAAAGLAGDDLLRAAARKARREGRHVFSSRPGLRAWGWAAAASLAVVAGVLVWRVQPGAPAQEREYATTVGEQRTIQLADGTTLLLDTGSAVTVRLGGQQREVEVDAGRVQLEVGEDPRPFLVHAGATVIRDIGTTFQVSREGGTVNVGLVDGAVVVSATVPSGRTESVQLSPGEQVAVQAGAGFEPVRTLDMAVAEGWTQGELVFKERRLDALLVEANRYSRTKLALADPALGGMTVSGVFRAGNQEALVSALERGWGLRAERVGKDEILLHQ